MRSNGALAAVAMVVVLGACTYSSKHASSTTSASSATTTEPSTATTRPPASTSTQPTPTTQPAVGRCPSADLSLSVGPQQGAAGTQYFEIGFRNRAAFACALDGYPGVSFLDASGRQIGAPAQRNVVAHGPVTLAPSATAYAQVGVGNPGNFDCKGVTPQSIRVYPPNETVAILATPPTGLLVCLTQGTPLVGPVASR